MKTTNSNRPLTLDDDLPHLHDNPGARHKLQVISSIFLDF